MNIKKLFGVLMLCLVLIGALACGAMAEDDVAVDEISFPDEVFREFVSEEYDENSDGVLSEDEIEAVTELYLKDCSVDSLQGVEVFTSLEEVVFEKTQVENADLSGCASLRGVIVSSSEVKSLNVSGCTHLAELRCASCGMTGLDASGCSRLLLLDCKENELTSLDLTGCPKLCWLYCHGNELATLDISGCPRLRNVVAKKYAEGRTVFKRGGIVLSVDVETEIVPPVLDAPAITKLTNTASGVKLVWSASEGAGGYEVYRKVSGGSWEKLADTQGTTYTDGMAESGVKYAYRVRAAAEDEDAFCMSVSQYSATKTKLYLGRPVIESAENTEEGILLTWSETPGAAQYRVFRKASGGSWEKLATVEGTEYTDAAAEAGVKYAYRLKALSSSGKTAGVYSANKVIRCAE